ncbi:hypothetical protein AZ006_004751 [Citrobacter freundii]|nr:hypothetical protein AZ006_004751 [Citrobacter freundii]
MCLYLVSPCSIGHPPSQFNLVALVHFSGGLLLLPLMFQGYRPLHITFTSLLLVYPPDFNPLESFLFNTLVIHFL